jgi:hypothetical protein
VDPNDAKQALRDRGVRFAESRFLRAVQTGDVPLVRLFLDAGLSPSAQASNGETAVVVAARQGNTEIARALLEAGADPGDLVAATKRQSSQKDSWEKLANLSGVLTFLASLAIAGAGWYFTTSYNNRQLEIARQQNTRDLQLKQEQNRITEMQTVEKFIPHFSEGEEPKRASLLAIKALARSELWAELAEMTGGSGSVDALRQGARGADGQKEAAAVRALSHIASRADDADATRARGALAEVFAAERSAMLRVKSGGSECSGFSVLGKEPRIATAGCVNTMAATVEIETSNHLKTSAAPISIQADTGLALLRPAAPLPQSLLLADKKPSTGSATVGMLFDREGNVQTLPGRIDSVDATVNLNLNGRSIVGRGWMSLIMDWGAFSEEHPGLAGSPILDETGKVLCVVVAAAGPRLFCAPLELEPGSKSPGEPS